MLELVAQNVLELDRGQVGNWSEIDRQARLQPLALAWGKANAEVAAQNASAHR